MPLSLYSHLLQNDAGSLVDGSSHISVPTRVADKGPRQHGHHDRTKSAVAKHGEGGQADKKKQTREYVEEAHQDKEHSRSPEGAEEVFGLWIQRERASDQEQNWN